MTTDVGKTAVVSIRQLLSTLIDASCRGCHVIRAIQSHESSKELSVHIKMEGDKSSPVTIADVKAQHVIVATIRNFWGEELRIVGEEDNTDLSITLDDSSAIIDRPLRPDLDVTFHRENFDNSSPSSSDVLSAPISELTVYIDPLDGTREFIEGRLQNVTCLIGVSHNSRPLCGVVSYPFPAGTSTGSGITRVIYGYVPLGHGDVMITPSGTLTPVSGIPAPPGAEKEEEPHLKYAVGDSRPKVMAQLCSLFRSLYPSSRQYQMGACGNKIISVARGDMHLSFMKNNNCSWDTAAPSAVLESCGGKITDWFGEALVYSKESGNMRNTRGVVVSGRGFEAVHDAFCERVKEDESFLEFVK